MSEQVGHNPTPKKRHRKPWEKAFIASLSLTGNVREACASANVHRSVVYALRNSNEDFAAAWDSAYEDAADLLEKEARRRAYDGVDEPVFYQGAECGTVRKYSDTLLIFLLKGAKPDKYRETYRHQLEGKDGAPEIVVRSVTAVLPGGEDG